MGNSYTELVGNIPSFGTPTRWTGETPKALEHTLQWQYAENMISDPPTSNVTAPHWHWPGVLLRYTILVSEGQGKGEYCYARASRGRKARDMVDLGSSGICGSAVCRAGDGRCDEFEDPRSDPTEECSRWYQVKKLARTKHCCDLVATNYELKLLHFFPLHQ